MKVLENLKKSGFPFEKIGGDFLFEGRGGKGVST